MNDIMDQLRDLDIEVDEALERLSGDEKLYVKLLNTFFDGEPLKGLKASFTSKNPSDEYRLAHNMKGSSLNLGLLPIADLAIEMLQLLRDHKEEEAISFLPEFERSFNDFYAKIKPIIKEEEP